MTQILIDDDVRLDLGIEPAKSLWIGERAEYVSDEREPTPVLCTIRDPWQESHGDEGF